MWKNALKKELFTVLKRVGFLSLHGFKSAPLGLGLNAEICTTKNERNIE